MGFTVTRPAVAADAGLILFTRELNYFLKTLAQVPRVPDPENPRRRAPAWEAREPAQRFVEKLRKVRKKSTWRVEPTAAAVSVGPFGPVLVQMDRSVSYSVLTAHGLSNVILRDYRPRSAPGVSDIYVRSETWAEYVQAGGSLARLVEETLPLLTGLRIEQLRELGYALVNGVDDFVYLDVPPAALGVAHPTFAPVPESVPA